MNANKPKLANMIIAEINPRISQHSLTATLNVMIGHYADHRNFM
jgi:hypothetical protein